MQFSIWFVNYLLRHRRASIGELLSAWQRHSGLTMHRNTFRAQRAKAEDLFGINIEYDPATNTYGIEDPTLLEDDRLSKWMLGTFGAAEVLQRRRGLSGRIILEPQAKGWEHLDTVTQAMAEGHRLRVTHRQFGSTESHSHIIAPWFVKQFRQRWYVIGPDESGSMRVMAFDRIERIETDDTTFTMPCRMTADTCFGDLYGVILGDGSTACTIRLKVTHGQGAYLITRPLHPSQRIISTDGGDITLEVHLRPTYDFMQEVLSLGDCAEILAPEDLRDEIAGIIEAMRSIYRP